MVAVALGNAVIRPFTVARTGLGAYLGLHERMEKRRECVLKKVAFVLAEALADDVWGPSNRSRTFNPQAPQR